MNFKKISLTLVVMALAMGAFAQRGGGFGQRGGFGNGPLQLVNRDDVKDELKITADQTTKLQELQEKQRSEMRDARQNMGGGGFNEETMKKMAELQAKLAGEASKELDTILTPDQNKRLKELVFQRSGYSIVNNALYQDELGVTADQKAKLATLQQQQMEAMRGLFTNQDMSREERQAAFEKNNKIMQDEIAKILTDDQKKKIETGKGKPFTFKDTPRGN